MEGNMKVAIMTDVMKMDFTERPIPLAKGMTRFQLKLNMQVCVVQIFIILKQVELEETLFIHHLFLDMRLVVLLQKLEKNVTHLKVGDKVALEPGKTCGHCEFCKTGRYNLCPDVIFFATPPIDGVFQEYVAHEAALCFKIPDNMDTMEAA